MRIASLALGLTIGLAAPAIAQSDGVRPLVDAEWVVGDDWLDAEETIELLPRFDVQMPRPSYLVNRWLTAIFGAFEDEIGDLVRRRDRVLAAYKTPNGGSAREDRTLEATSEWIVPRPAG